MIAPGTINYDQEAGEQITDATRAAHAAHLSERRSKINPFVTNPDLVSARVEKDLVPYTILRITALGQYAVLSQLRHDELNILSSLTNGRG